MLISPSSDCPFGDYIQTKDPKYLALGKSFPDRQWENPTPDGLTAETRYWIDDMYMITAVAGAGLSRHRRPKYLDRAALEMVGLPRQAAAAQRPLLPRARRALFWGRGNGWVAAGMAEMLRSLPADHPQRARILAGYRKMMAALLQYQGADGMWRQLIDHPEAWPETSCTGMFTFAMITGVKNGWLDPKTYGPAARKAWLGPRRLHRSECRRHQRLRRHRQEK